MDWFDEKVWPVIANRAQAFESLKVQNEKKTKTKRKTAQGITSIKEEKNP